MAKKKKPVASRVSYRINKGKLKIKKGEYVDINPIVEYSTKEAVVSRLDNIISQEDVVIDTADCRVNIQTYMMNELYTAEMFARTNVNKLYTIALPISKKNALNVFDFMGTSILSAILRTSTFCYSVNKLMKGFGGVTPENIIINGWEDLNKDDCSNFTNVLYVPKVLEFIDFNKGKIRKDGMFSFNTLVLAIPSKDKMSDDEEEVSVTDAASRVIADICDAAIKCGCKDLIVNPFGHKYLAKSKSDTAKLWKQISTSQRFIENFDSVTFAVGDEDDFVIFDSVNSSKAVGIM